MSSFSPSALTPSSSRNQIKKSMSDRSGKSPDSSSSPTHQVSSSPQMTHHSTSPSRSLSSAAESHAEHLPKKSALSFHLFDSILQRSVSKPLTINTSTQELTIPSKKLSSASSLSTTSNVQLPEQARCLHSYNAIKEDEICVQKGEYVQIVAANQDNRWFVHRDATRSSPAAEGWIPGFVLGLKQSQANVHPNLSPTSPPVTSHSSNSLHRLTSSTSTSHHPTISYESTLPPKAQPSTCDKV